MRTDTEDAITFRGTFPADMIGREVKVQPFYHLPVGGESAKSMRAEQSFPAHVTARFGTEMVVVELAPGAPGSTHQAFHPFELHDPHACACRACR